MPTRIRQRLSSAISDQTVTPKEAEEIVAAAKAERKWTPKLQRELTAFMKTNAAKLDPGAKQVLEQFVATARPRVDLPDPALRKEDRTDTTWTPVGPDAKLYVDGISASDVVQGYIGDCFLASALSSMAAANPELIKNAIEDHGDGTYTVRFYQGVEAGHPKAVKITIDDDLAIGAKGGGYLLAQNSKELWPALVEKAYAKWKGGFHRLDSGGSASDVFEALSGKVAHSNEVKDYRPNALFKKLETLNREHLPIAVGTFSEGAHGVHFKGTGVLDDHFYSVLGTSVERGQKLIVLRNPWGDTEPAHNGKDDGRFKLPLKDFVKLYENVEFGG